MPPTQATCDKCGQLTNDPVESKEDPRCWYCRPCYWKSEIHYLTNAIKGFRRERDKYDAAMRDAIAERTHHVDQMAAALRDLGRKTNEEGSDD